MTGGDLDERISADVTYSKPAVNRFVRKVAEAIDREPQDASVNPSGDSLEVVAAQYGRKLRDNLLTQQIERRRPQRRRRSHDRRARRTRPSLR